MNPLPRPWSASPLARLLLVGFLSAVLAIPMAMIENVVRERAQRKAEAHADIHARWGGAQTIVGPLLRLACVHRYQEKTDKGWGKPIAITRELYVLPETLEAELQLNTEIRKRGIFEVPVYAAPLRLAGHFAVPSLAQCPQPSTEIDWSRSALVLGISDPRSVQAESGLIWNGRHHAFRPATGAPAPLSSGLHVPLGASAGAAAVADFSIVLSLRGSVVAQLAPMGKETRVRIAGDWPHPSYQGAWLPDERRGDEHGFEARWSLSWLGRDFPQLWSTPAEYEAAIARSLFGVVLATPVDTHALALRVTKYAVLTVLFTFLTVWLAETLSGARVHPVQYGFIGASLCLFGLLQLSIAEHMGFGIAFAAAALAVTLQVGLYLRTVLGSARRALWIGALLGGLYAWLYAILNAEDYALLGGSLALFALLATAMYATRRVDWFGSGPGGATP